jgi:hypothetical protein
VKIGYADFLRASQGDEGLTSKCIDIFKTQKMLVISDVPEANLVAD